MEEALGTELVGRYVLHDAIGAGGMATVHYARLVGAAGFARTVAIKRLHPHLARHPEFAAMFLDEARLAARIRHPNVVATLDVVAEDGELSLVLEYVAGESLSNLLRLARERNQPVPYGIGVAVVAAILHGLHAAHEARSATGELLGIVHRDVSPHNILVGADGIPRLIDFGIAKAVGRIQTTREGQAKGKLAYMAPEQLTTGEVDRRTDVYAAGIVLWEALTTQRLFDAPSEAQLYGQVLCGSTEAPSVYAPDVPPELDAIVMRALDADPHRRWPSAMEMALALEAAGPLAPQSAIAAWVDGLARDALSRRAGRVAAIEAAEALGEAVPPGAPVESVDEPSTATEETARLAPIPVAPASPSRRARWVAGTALAATLLFAGAGALRWQLARAQASPSLEPEVFAEAQATAATPPVPPASQLSQESVQPEPTAAAPKPEPPVQAKTSKAPSHTPARRELRSREHAKCDPPVWVDDNGFKHYKPECVK